MKISVEISSSDPRGRIKYDPGKTGLSHLHNPLQDDHELAIPKQERRMNE
jgi:hypothetical protein